MCVRLYVFVAQVHQVWVCGMRVAYGHQAPRTLVYALYDVQCFLSYLRFICSHAPVVDSRMLSYDMALLTPEVSPASNMSYKSGAISLPPAKQ